MDNYISRVKKIISTRNPFDILIIFTTFLLLFIICVNSPIDPDMWWHLQNGKVTISENTILTTDQFSFSRFNQPWTNVFWLSDTFIYLVNLLGGLTFLVIIFATFGAVTYLIIFFISPGPYILRAFIVILAAISTSPEWTIRPQVISFLMVGLLNYFIERAKSPSLKNYLWIPLVFLLWANLHGGFIWGILLLIAIIIGQIIEIYILQNENINKSEWKSLSIISVISFFILLINPNGFAVWKLPFQTIGESFSSISEWSSPNFHNPIMQPFLWFVLILLTSVSLSEKRITADQIFKMVGFLFLAFLSQRNIPIAVIVLTPILITKANEFFNKVMSVGSKLESQTKNNRLKGSSIINIVIIIILVLASIGRVITQTNDSIIEENYPVNAVKWIKNNKPEGNLFNSYNWGGYLIYNLPEYKVFIDGRADLFGKEFISDWWNIVNDGVGSLDSLESYGINLVLVEPDRPIINRLLENNWKLSYQDEISIIVTR